MVSQGDIVAELSPLVEKGIITEEELRPLVRTVMRVDPPAAMPPTPTPARAASAAGAVAGVAVAGAILWLIGVF